MKLALYSGALVAAVTLIGCSSEATGPATGDGPSALASAPDYR